MNEPLTCLDPKVDLAFKALLGREESKDLLASLIEGILAPEEPIVEIEILNPFILGHAIDEKVSILDLKVRNRAGRRYGVEMQCLSHPAFPERILYYGSRLVGEQLREGDPYTLLEPVNLIVFANFVIFPALRRYHSIYELLERQTRLRFSGHLRIDLVELPKFRKRPEAASTLEEMWISFLKEGHQLSHDVLERWDRPDLSRAKEELRRLCADETLRRQYEGRIQHLRDWVTSIEGSFQKGLEKGREEGAGEERRLLVQRLLRRGLAVQEVAELTGLSRDDVERIPLE